MARRYTPPSDAPRPSLRQDRPSPIRASSRQPGRRDLSPGSTNASARPGLSGRPVSRISGTPPALSSSSRGSIGSASARAGGARLATQPRLDRSSKPGLSANARSGSSRLSTQPPLDATRRIGSARSGVSIPGLPPIAMSRSRAQLDDIGTRVFAGKGRDSFVQHSHRHYRSRWGLSFCFSGSSFYTGFWNYSYGRAYAPYYHDCYSLRWGRDFYWWLPANCYPYWRRYWSSWWLHSTSFVCRPWALNAYWGTPVGFYAYNAYESPGSAAGIYTGHMEEVEELRESTSAEKYKDASIDELARHYLELGDLYFKTRRYVRAITAYEKAVELVPGDGSLHLVLADALFADGRFARAAYELRQAFDLHPELAQANVDKREFYGHPDDFAKHMDALVKDIDEKPFDSNARLVYVVNLLLSGGLEEAERQIEILATHLRGDGIIPLLTEAIAKAIERVEGEEAR
jgi:tetratricopeptide (TPR) repeat protein